MFITNKRLFGPILRILQPIFFNQTASKSWLYFWVFIVICSLFLAIHYPYIGEEGQYTIPPMEMHYYHSYLVPLTFGGVYGRPPLYHWLVMLCTPFFGWQAVLWIARGIAISASACTGILLGFWVQRWSRNIEFALFTVLIYFSGDLLFRRSWIAYADPLFSFFCLLAVTGLWLGLQKKKSAWLLAAAVGLMAGFLTKALTIYVFYGVTLFLFLCFQPEARKTLLQPWSIGLHFLAFVAPFLWMHWATASTATVGDMTRALQGTGLQIATKIVTVPVEVFLRLLPMSFLVALALFLKSAPAVATPGGRGLPHRGLVHKVEDESRPDSVRDPSIDIKIIFYSALVNSLPYWFSFQTFRIRYLMPLLPFIAVLFSYVLVRRGPSWVRCALVFLIVEIVLKIATGVSGLPWFEHMNTDFPRVAATIRQRAQGFPLYVANDWRAEGLSLTATLDEQRWPAAPLTGPPPGWSEGFAFTSIPDPVWGPLVQTYLVAHQNPIYLYCRGAACVNKVPA